MLLTAVPVFFSSEGIVFWEEAGATHKLTHSLKGFDTGLTIVLFSRETSLLARTWKDESRNWSSSIFIVFPSTSVFVILASKTDLNEIFAPLGSLWRIDLSSKRLKFKDQLGRGRLNRGVEIDS